MATARPSVIVVQYDNGEATRSSATSFCKEHRGDSRLCRAVRALRPGGYFYDHILRAGVSRPIWLNLTKGEIATIRLLGGSGQLPRPSDLDRAVVNSLIRMGLAEKRRGSVFPTGSGISILASLRGR